MREPNDWRRAKEDHGWYRGIDVSLYQGNINFQKVKNNGIQFAICRAYGSSRQTGGDRRFQEYTSGFRSVGIPVGSYFYAWCDDEYDLNSARHQANLYADKLESTFGNGKWGDLYPFIDFEGNEAHGGRHNSLDELQMLKWIDAFRDQFESRFNNRVKLGIYSSWGFISYNGFDKSTILNDMPLWIAKWRTNSIPNTGGWTNWVAWQYTDQAQPFSSGQAVGVSSTGLDMNYVRNLDDIRTPRSVSTPIEEKEPIDLVTRAENIKAEYRDNHSVLVSWKPSADSDITKQEVYRNNEKIAELDKDAKNYVDDDINYDTVYTYTIRTYDENNWAESYRSNSVNTANSKPSTPTGLTIEEFDRAIKLTWNYNIESEEVTEYTIYLNGDKYDVTNENAYLIHGLDNDVEYTFNVQAHNDNPLSSDLSTSVIGTPRFDFPTVPTSLEVNYKNNETVLLNWIDQPKDNFSHYEVMTTNTETVLAENLKTTSYTLNTLLPNHTYSIKVRSYDLQGDYSESESVTINMHKPSKVKKLQSIVRDREIEIYWLRNTEDFVVSYQIYMNGNFYTEVTDTNSVLFEGLENGKEYSFSVCAVSDHDIRGYMSDILTVSPVADYPNKANNLQADIIDEKTIEFSWEHEQKETFDYYEIKVNDKVVATTTDVLSFTYENAKSNFDYTFQVVTIDNQGDETLSGTVKTRINIPTIPINFKAKPKDREVILNWDKNIEDFVESYNIYRNEELIANIKNNSYTDINLINNVDYSYQVQAVANNTFTSLRSEYVYATPLLDVPNTPQIISHEELGGNGVKLTWEHTKKPRHSHYNLYRNGYLYAENIKEKSYNVDYLESNKNHVFTIRAFDNQGDSSDFSDEYNVILYAKILNRHSTRLGEIDRDMEVVTPNLYLCKPNKQTIGKLSDIFDLTLNTKYADLNELNFSMPLHVDIRNEQKRNPYYDLMHERYLIRLELGEKVEYFIINEVNDNAGENEGIKTVHAWSLGYELRDKKVTTVKEEIYTALQAFETALRDVLNWDIGRNVRNLNFYWNQESRHFDVSDKTVLEFIQEIATTYNAILEWDTIDRVIDFKNPYELDENKGLFVKYGKYLKNLSKTYKADEMVTRIIPIGENNLTINEVNSNGSNHLDDFSYFMRGFERSFDEYGQFYLELDYLNEQLEINVQEVCYGILNAVHFFKQTQKNEWLNYAIEQGNFLLDRQSTGSIEGSNFQYIPDKVTNENGIYSNNDDVVNFRTQYLSVYALIKLYEITNDPAYNELIEGIIRLCSFAQNEITERVNNNLLSDNMVGSLFENIVKETVDVDVTTFTFTENYFSLSDFDVFAKAWKEYIDFFGNEEKLDSAGRSYVPQELLNDSAIFLYEAYNFYDLSMTEVHLPYEYYHFDEALLVEEGEKTPLPKNFDGTTWGNVHFDTVNTFRTILGFTLLSKYNNVNDFSNENEELTLEEIAYQYKSQLFNLKNQDRYPKEIIFYGNYNYDGTPVDVDSIDIRNTSIYLLIEDYLGNNKDTVDKLKQTTINNKENIGEVIYALSQTNTSMATSSSDFMSDDLCIAILDYNDKLNNYEGQFQELYRRKTDEQKEKTALENERFDYELELEMVQDLLDSFRAEESLKYEQFSYVGSPRSFEYDLDKDYKYILMAKVDTPSTSTLTAKNGTYTLDNTEWQILEKFDYDRTGESEEEEMNRQFTYDLQFTGTDSTEVEFYVIRILTTEFEEEGNESDLLRKYNEEVVQNDIDATNDLINGKQREIDNIDTEISHLESELSIENNFTVEQMHERDLFIISEEYSDEKINNPVQLKERAEEKLKEIIEPTLVIEISIVNFLEILEEMHNWDKLTLGDIINIRYESFNLDLIQAKIIAIDFSFDEKSISLTISNVKDMKTNQEKFIDSLYNAIATSSKVTREKSKWYEGIEAKENFESFIEKDFDATKQKIIAGTNEAVEISRRGLIIRSDVNDDSFLVANSSVLAITNDSGKTYKNAITTDGVIAERLIGRIIAGENLTIQNSAGNFTVDENGVTIENQALKIIGGIRKDQLSDDIDFDFDKSGLVGTYTNTNDGNDTDTTTVTTPIVATDGTQVQHTNETTDLVNISFTWDFDEELEGSSIDGFMVYIFTSYSSADYEFGTNVTKEISVHVDRTKRSIVLYGVPKDLYYNFGIEAYRVVDKEIESSGVFTSPIVETSPYNPVNHSPYTGDILGTIDYKNEVKLKLDVVTAIKEGQSYDNVTIDSNNGLIVENSNSTVKTILNSDGFRIQTNDGTGYFDSFRATTDGQVVADDLIANRLIVNDGTGTELINANTKQINFDNFDVITGDIHADNINIKGLEVINDTGTTTFSVDNAGNVTVNGNINMTSGSITWENVNQPVTNADNTFDQLRYNSDILGFQYDSTNNQLFLNASHIKAGTIDVDDGITISSSSGGVTIDSLGVNVQNGTFTVEDEAGTRFDLQRRVNLIFDHSFELLEPDYQGGNPFPEASQQYHSYFYLDYSDIGSSGIGWFYWGMNGSPALKTVRNTDLYTDSIFGLQQVSVNNSNYFGQYLRCAGNGVMTLSSYVMPNDVATKGKPRMEVWGLRWEYANYGGGDYELIIGKTFDVDYSLGDYTTNPQRISFSFDVSGFAELRIEIKSDGTGWVDYDGVQLVQHDKPVLYEPEQASFNQRTGVDKYPQSRNGKFIYPEIVNGYAETISLSQGLEGVGADTGNGYNILSVRGVVDESYGLAIPMEVSIYTQGSWSGYKDITYPVYLDEPPLAIIGTAINGNSYAFNVSIYNITSTSCRVYVRHIDYISSTLTIDVSLFIVGKRR